MVNRLSFSLVAGIVNTLLIVLLAPTTSLAQRPLIGEESRGTGIQIGYSAADDIHGIVGGLGFTTSRKFDIGIAAGVFASGGGDDIASLGFHAQYYAFSIYGKQSRFFVSFDATVEHDWNFHSGSSFSASDSYMGYTIGPTLTFGPHREKAQILFSVAMHYLDYSDHYQEDHLLKLAGATFAFSRTGTSWLGLSLGYSNNDSQSTFTIGLLIVAEKL